MFLVVSCSLFVVCFFVFFVFFDFVVSRLLYVVYSCVVLFGADFVRYLSLIVRGCRLFLVHCSLFLVVGCLVFVVRCFPFFFFFFFCFELRDVRCVYVGC